MARADHGRRAHGARPVRGRVPGGARRPGRRARPAVRRRRVRPRLLERGRRARRGRARRTAAVRARALSCRRARVRDDAEPILSARGAHAACRSRTGCPEGARNRVIRARGFDDVLDPLGPAELASLFPYSVRVLNSGMTLIAVGPAMTLRRPVWALYVLIVGLALHNLVMALLWRAGSARRARSRSSPPGRTCCSWRRSRSSSSPRRGRPFKAHRRPTGSRSPSARSSCSTALLPQSWLGGGATHKGVLYGARHDLLPVGGVLPRPRCSTSPTGERARLCRVTLAVAAGVAVFGLARRLPRAALWWRGSAGWFSDQLGLDYTGSPGCPRTSSTTPATASSSAASPRRSSRRSRLPICSSSRSSSSRSAGAGALPLGVAALRRAALDPHALRAARPRRRAAACSRSCAAACGRSRSRSSVAVLGLRVREGLRPLRAAHALHAGRARDPAADREGASRRLERPDERERVVDERAPCEPARRRAHRRSPPVGLRPRQRGRDRRAHARRGEGGRVDVHRARGRDGPRSARSSSSRGRSLLLRARAHAAPVARCGVRRGAGDRSPDRRDRRAVDRRRASGRSRAIRARRRNASDRDESATVVRRFANGHLRRAAAFVPWRECVSRSSSSPLLALAGTVLVAALPRCSATPSTPVLRASWTLTPGVLNPASRRRRSA